MNKTNIKKIMHYDSAAPYKKIFYDKGNLKA